MWCMPPRLESTGRSSMRLWNTMPWAVPFWWARSVSYTHLAPTGRAAKRMGEATGMDAFTIHRLLEYTGGDNAPRFQRDQDHPLDYDAVIVDETRMVDVFLLMRLLRANRPESRLILIGDADQLPSVGP